MKPSNRFSDLTELVTILRKECPWDRKQTHESIKDNLIEEAYEVVEAIDHQDMDELRTELGDLLLHVLFHSQIASEKGEFSVVDVIESLSEKLIRRHPHIFDDTDVENDEDVARNWETIKLKEGRKSLLDGIPAKLPALIKADRLQQKASNAGFDWKEWPLAWEKLEEELSEWKQALESNSSAAKNEFGDLLFSMVNVGRLLKIKPEDALRATNSKFERRFRFIETELEKSGRNPMDASLDEMDQLWNEAKKQE